MNFILIRFRSKPDRLIDVGVPRLGVIAVVNHFTPSPASRAARAARWASKGSKERYRDDVAKEEIASSLRLVPKLLALKKAVENGMDDDLFDEEGQWILVGDELRAALAALDAGEGVK